MYVSCVKFLVMRDVIDAVKMRPKPDRSVNFFNARNVSEASASTGNANISHCGCRIALSGTRFARRRERLKCDALHALISVLMPPFNAWQIQRRDMSNGHLRFYRQGGGCEYIFGMAILLDVLAVHQFRDKKRFIVGVKCNMYMWEIAGNALGSWANRQSQENWLFLSKLYTECCERETAADASKPGSPNVSGIGWRAPWSGRNDVRVWQWRCWLVGDSIHMDRQPRPGRRDNERQATVSWRTTINNFWFELLHLLALIKRSDYSIHDFFEYDIFDKTVHTDIAPIISIH